MRFISKAVAVNVNIDAPTANALTPGGIVITQLDIVITQIISIKLHSPRMDLFNAEITVA